MWKTAPETVVGTDERELADAGDLDPQGGEKPPSLGSGSEILKKVNKSSPLELYWGCRQRVTQPPTTAEQDSGSLGIPSALSQCDHFAGSANLGWLCGAAVEVL